MPRRSRGRLTSKSADVAAPKIGEIVTPSEPSTSNANNEIKRHYVLVGLNYAPEPTGIAPYTTSLSRGLAERGHSVKVITGYPHYPTWRVFDGYGGWSIRQLIDGVKVLRLRHYVPEHPSFLRRTVMEVTFGLRAALIPWGHPDAVVTVSPALFSSLLVMARAKLGGIPIVTWVQDIYTVGVGEAGSARTLASIVAVPEGILTRRSERVVAIHDRFKRAIAVRMGVAPDKIDVVRNWSHVAPHAAGRDEAMRASHGWHRDEIIVLHAGNMGAKQGLGNVVAASQVAADRQLPIKFVLLGDGNQRKSLEAMGSNPSLQFIDPLPDGTFEQTLASADVLLVNERPGLTDMSVPSKLTTYFTTGLPVVGAVDEGSITAEELEAVGCPRVDPKHPEALVDAIVRLVGDPIASQEIGARGKAFSERRLGADAAITAFERILDSTVSRRRRQAMLMPENSTPGTATDAVQRQK